MKTASRSLSRTLACGALFLTLALLPLGCGDAASGASGTPVGPVLPPEQVRAQLVVERNPPEINSVTRLGSYHFYDFASLALPAALPTIEALPTSNGLPGYVIQAWHIDGRRVLILRGMPTEVAGSVPAAPPEDEDAPTLQD